VRCYKKPIFKTAIIGTLAMVSLGMVFVAEARAGCGNLEGHKAGAVQPLSRQGTGQFGPLSLLLVADREASVDRIVGFWKATLVSEGNSGIPDGTVIDAGFAQWHSDGTEILNSSRPAASSNFCLGIWKKTGMFHYTLNHFALSSDPSTDNCSARPRSVKKSSWIMAVIPTLGPLRLSWTPKMRQLAKVELCP
jgi:hypothetical protein